MKNQKKQKQPSFLPASTNQLKILTAEAERTESLFIIVTPAQAGAQSHRHYRFLRLWMPACAGKAANELKDLELFNKNRMLKT